MQISTSTLIASQQPAASSQPAPAVAGFTAALEKSDGFSPLPLKQAAPVADTAPPPMPKGPARLGSQIDIKI